MRHRGDGQRPADSHVTAWGPGPRPAGERPAWLGVPPPLADGFVARPETAPALAAALVPSAVVALVPGLDADTRPGHPGSCGKTQLAVSCAESLHRSGHASLLAWVTGTSRASVLSGYAEAAAAAGIDPAGTAESVAARFTAWLSRTARPWLVVIDDLRSAAALEGLWPCGPAGRVVITTPDQETVSGEPRAQILPVGVFSHREAMKYLMGRLTADPDQRHGAVSLAAELGCEPSALAQASAAIASSMLSCSDYQRHFTHQRARLASRAGREPLTAAAVTWTLSAEQAARLSPGGATQLLLALAALLDGHVIPGTVFTSPATCRYLAKAGGSAAADPEHARDAVASLERTGLLTMGPASAPPAVWISQVLAGQVRAATPEGILDQAAQAAAGALLEAWPDDDSPLWPAVGLRSCASSLHRAAGDRLWAAGRCHPLLLRTADSMDRARLTGPAVHCWSELAQASGKFAGPGSPDTLTAGGQLARALLAAGQAAEAADWSQWVLDGLSRVRGTDHPDTLAARVCLGQALAAAGQPGHAVTILYEAVAEYERVCGSSHLATLHARAELAVACHAAGKPADAIGIGRRTLADRERVQGPRHADTMSARDQLASACLADGRFTDAVAHYRRALADREHVLGPDHPDTIAARRNVASAHHAAGNISAALQLYEQACADDERILGANHARTLAHRADLAHAYYAAGRLTDAVSLLSDTLSRCDKALPPGDPLTHAIREAMHRRS